MNQQNKTNIENLTRHGADFSNARIAWIEACWHQDIVSQARQAFVSSVAEHGISEQQISVSKVPGSLEIPLQTKLLANSGNYDAIIASGLIVDGGIYRHDFVATTVLDAMMRVSLDSEVPVLSVVLTPHHYQETEEHHRYFFDHFSKKGQEAANACVRTLENMHKLKAAGKGQGGPGFLQNS